MQQEQRPRRDLADHLVGAESDMLSTTSNGNSRIEPGARLRAQLAARIGTISKRGTIIGSPRSPSARPRSIIALNCCPRLRRRVLLAGISSRRRPSRRTRCTRRCARRRRPRRPRPRRRSCGRRPDALRIDLRPRSKEVEGTAACPRTCSRQIDAAALAFALAAAAHVEAQRDIAERGEDARHGAHASRDPCCCRSRAAPRKAGAALAAA